MAKQEIQLENDSFFPFWLFQLSPGNARRVTAVLTPSSWACSRSTLVCQQIPGLVHYHTALTTGIPRAAPKHPLLSCISLLLTAACSRWSLHLPAEQIWAWSAEPECSWLSRNSSTNLFQSLWSMAQLCPKKDNTARTLTTNFSFLEMCHFWKALLPLVHPLHWLCAQGRANPDPRLCNLIPTLRFECRAAADASNMDKMDTGANNGSIYWNLL